MCSNMDGPRDYHTTWSKSEWERKISNDITYIWNLKKKHTKELTYKIEIDSKDIEDKLMVTKKGKWGDGEG